MANIQVTDLKETLNSKYDVNSTADGSFTGTESPANITMMLIAQLMVVLQEQKVQQI